MNLLPIDFGKGWLTTPASDLCRIMVAFTAIDAKELVLTIQRIHKGTSTANIATVERAISLLQANGQ